MKKLLAFVCLSLTFSSALAHPQDGLSPEGLMHYYVKVFNEENLPALQDVYHSPHVKIVSGRLTVVDDKNIPAIDFDALKKTGWKYSKVNAVKLLAEGANAALVELNFSRFDASDREFFRQTGYYHLTKNNGYWQIISLENMGQVPGVKAK